jgi:PleD family two-component response regulator
MDIRVLIVDDCESELSFIGEALKSVGVEYMTTTEPEGVLGIAIEYKPTLIVTDINMPKMDGFSVVQQIKSCAETVHIPVIFFSASDKQEDVIKGLHYGCVDFINKPINVQDFVKVVISHSSVESMREILSPLKCRTGEIMRKYSEDI